MQEARPVCRKLAADTGETVNIAVLSERSALYLDQVAGSSALQPHNWVGQHIPLHATSNGKVLLSGLDDGRMTEMLGTLYKARGELALATPAGDHFLPLYESNMVRITELVSQDPVLAEMTVSGLEEVMPALNALIEGDG